MHEPRKITFIIPRLLPPPAAVSENDLPDCRTLTRVLTCADRESCSDDYYRLLIELFGISLPVDVEYPVAALSYFSDTGQRADYCLRADPVHLSASGEGVVLLDDAMIVLERAEAESIAIDLQPYFEELEAELHIPHPARWYLCFHEAPRIQTTPLPEVIGRDVGMALPAGPDRTRWRQLFNEIQMVLYTSSVNETRTRQGRLPVNSLWFWGPGPMPEQGKTDFDYCFSDDPFVRGLAALHDIPAAGLPASASDALEQAGEVRHVLVTDGRARQHQSYGNAAAWLGYVESLENDWLQPLEREIKRGRLQQLEILTNGTRFSYRRRHRWRLWRRGSLV